MVMIARESEVERLFGKHSNYAEASPILLTYTGNSKVVLLLCNSSHNNSAFLK